MKTTPKLNGENGYFLRGGSESQAGKFQEEDINSGKLTYTDRYPVWGSKCEGGSQMVQKSFQNVTNGSKVLKCKQTQNVQHSGEGLETRPKNMAVLFYMKVK